MNASVYERFAAKVDWPAVPTACWRWTAARNKDGYGTFYLEPQRRKVQAHRASFELARGPIPAGLVLDHLCRVRICVNPLHLEPVTDAVNVLRGESFSRVNYEKTHCVNGHPFDALNTYRWRGTRLCRVCNRQNVARYKQRVRAEGGAR